MNKLKGLLLTEGMHGMISQVEGLAKSLNIEFIHEKIELNSFWKLIPPKFTPSQNFTFKNDIKNTVKENFKEKKRGAIILGTKQKKVYFGKGSKKGRKYTGTSEF